ncbi:MAG: hypothetical protein IKZ96_00220 [Bacilli bacterium]|nr:hypothetical protein [Bacilli bacterium]
MERKGTFIRDLLVKILLIALFLFLLMYLFPMPNLTPFYSAIFNNNIQTMKDAAEDYYTVSRMPTEDGKSEKMTLKEMEQKKLIIPFVDKNGKSCDKNKSYVKVTKDGDEYVLKVSLTCSDESNYIIERIGCHDFCSNGICKTEEKKEETKKPVVVTDDEGTITVKVPTGKYVKEYEYKRELKKDEWSLGQWTDTKVTESNTVKLAETRTLYTGQKKIVTDNTEYKHIKYGYKDNWTIGEWVNKTETETETHKLYSKRTLYTGEKLEVIKTPRYEYAKTKYVLTKTVKSSETTCSDWKKDTTWRSSKPSNTTSKKWGSSYNSRTNTSWTLIQSSYKSTTVMPTIVENNGTKYKYELVSKVDKDNCTSNCSANNIIYYYNIYKQNSSNEYQYYYQTCETNSVNKTDTKTVYKKADSDSLVKQGYTLKSTTVEDKIWLDEGASVPANYVKTGETGTRTTNKYTSLGKWVTSKEKLGEYTYNISTAVQYKYADLTRTKYIEDTKWTKSSKPETGYEYTGETRGSKTEKYVDFGKWVLSKDLLGEYTYNIKTKTQYRYKYLNTETKTEYMWSETNPGEDWIATGKSREKYIQTGYKEETRTVQRNRQK